MKRTQCQFKGTISLVHAIKLDKDAIKMLMTEAILDCEMRGNESNLGYRVHLSAPLLDSIG